MDEQKVRNAVMKHKDVLAIVDNLEIVRGNAINLSSHLCDLLIKLQSENSEFYNDFIAVLSIAINQKKLHLLSKYEAIEQLMK